MKTTIDKTILWIARLVASLIMLQTLYFKFTGSEESVYIFTTVGMEPWGRWLVGSFELLASVLLLINRTAWFGAFVGLGLMAGALFMHATLLGIEVQEDGGYLFFLAIIVSVCCGTVLLIKRIEVERWFRTALKRAHLRSAKAASNS